MKPLAFRRSLQEACDTIPRDAGVSSSRTHDVEILEGHVRPEHVHLLLSVPPHLSPSRVMQAIKGKTSHHLLQDRRKLRAEFWGRHLWARGYFVASSGNVTDETIAESIRLQGAEPQDDDRFRISEE